MLLMKEHKWIRQSKKAIKFTGLIVIIIEIIIVTTIVTMVYSQLLPTQTFWIAFGSNPACFEFQWKCSGVSDTA